MPVDDRRNEACSEEMLMIGRLGGASFVRWRKVVIGRVTPVILVLKVSA